MNEEQERNEQDRWRELADLLGLPPESAPPAKTSPARERETAPPTAGKTSEYAREASSPFERPSARPELEHRSEPSHEPAPLDEAPPVWERQPVGRHEREEPVATELVEERESEPVAGDSAAAEVRGQTGERAERSEESDDRSRRRRRGRRGRRGGRRDREGGRDGGDSDTAERETPAAPSVEPSGDEDERHPRRRPPEDDIVDEPDAEAPNDEPPPPAEDGSDEPEESFAEWNVPSWTELIDSLYRPGR